jgi:hypothetical protein
MAYREGLVERNKKADHLGQPLSNYLPNMKSRDIDFVFDSSSCGRKGTRTPDLLGVSEAL